MVEALQRKIVAPGAKETRVAKSVLVTRASGIYENLHIARQLGITRWEENFVFNLHLGVRLSRAHRGPLSTAVEAEIHDDTRRFLISHGVDNSRSRTLELAANELVARAIKLDPDSRDFAANIDSSLVNIWASEWRERLSA